jgi:glycosyltransferase involved in cell wall biosynthesis
VPTRAFNLVFFSSLDWGHTWQRPQQLATRLGRHGRVLYVEPLGLRPPRARDLSRALRRLSTRAPIAQPRDATGSLEVCRAPLAYLPLPGSRLADRLNGRLLARRVQRWLRTAGGGAPILWIGVPSGGVVEAARRLPSRWLAYDCLDRFDLFHPGAAAIVRSEQTIARRADVVFAASADLFERMRGLNPRVRLVRNAADYSHFAAGRTAPAPEAIARLPRPIVGYVGEIAAWFDADAVSKLARRHPSWSVVLVGPRASRACALASEANVHHLGRIEYEELPRYVAHFDVCLLPFKVDALTSAASPVKLYEYLAAGKPVVSTPLKEVLPFRDLVTIADPGQLDAAVEVCLAKGADPALAPRRAAVASQNTWDHRVATILPELVSG